MDLITPNIGLLFWTTLIFIMVLILLRLFAWKPILNAIRTREHSIQAALEAADKAKSDMAKFEAKNEKILKAARAEKDAIIKEARELKEAIISEAKDKAASEAGKMFEAARLSIENERLSAIAQIKEQVALFSVEIAEKILREKLSGDKAQKELITKLLDEIELN